MSDIKISDMDPWVGAVTGNVEVPAVFANQNYRIALSQMSTSTFGFGSMALQNSNAVNITGGNVAVTALSGAITIANGGTGLGSAPANGQLLIGNGTDYTLANLTAGTGIAITNASGAITIETSGVGTVTSVDASGGSTGLTFSGGAITTSGTLTLGGTLAVANGGTGATTDAGARSALSAAKSGANSDITSLSGLTTPLSVSQGGTGANTIGSGYLYGNGTSPVSSTPTIPVADITGTMPVNKGGTGATTAAAALVNLLPAYAGNANRALTLDGTATNVVWSTVPLGTVVAVNASGGSTGLTFTGGPITSSGTLTMSGVLNLTNGGTGSTTAAGARNNILPTYTGNANRVLAVNASETDAQWVPAFSDGTVTSVSVVGGFTGLTFSGGPVTTSGTMTMAGTLNVASGGTGANTLTGYVKGNATSAFTASATIPFNDIAGRAFIQALSTVDQTGNIAAATAITFNSGTTGTGINITSNSRITFTDAGTYMIAPSLQFRNTDSQDHDVTVWFRKNGTDIPNSATVVTVAKTGDGGAAFFQIVFYETVTAGQYIEVMWLPEDIDITLDYVAAGAIAPAIPSAIVCAERIA